ncbi:MAG: branched-chain amino acid ABC transporter permease, partial [Desulfuromusa sp.]|nr:branched-chain amino acid ABC transporter permease [Desulfuromusa sp.]
MLKNFKQSILVSIWFVFLTFPLLVVRVNTMDQVVIWRWMNLVWVALGSFVLSYLWRYMFARQQVRKKVSDEGGDIRSPMQLLLEDMSFRYKAMGVLLLAALVFPLVFDTYQSTIMISALIYVVLGLGLNITVGLAGLLDLGYVAFFGVGAYSYALLNHHFDLGFWITLPIGGILGCLFGIVLGFPILRLRGDYLAIVTLGFGMIFKVVMENWDGLSFGPSGIANIDKPGFFGMDLSLANSTIYIYYIMIAMVIFTILVTNRLKNSRIGRAWIAMREDEVACVAMGIDIARTKLSAYALGAFWAGMVGVMFAA